MPNFTLISAVCHPHRASNLKIASLTDLNTADCALHNPGGYWNESEFLEECKSVFITSAWHFRWLITHHSAWCSVNSKYWSDTILPACVTLSEQYFVQKVSKWVDACQRVTLQSWYNNRYGRNWPLQIFRFHETKFSILINKISRFQEAKLLYFNKRNF